MNAFPHFRANVNGLGVHFIHARGQGHRPLPLLVTHGWPSSFVEMLDLIPLLADPAAHGGDPRTRSTWSCPPCRASGSRTARCDGA